MRAASAAIPVRALCALPRRLPALQARPYATSSNDSSTSAIHLSLSACHALCVRALVASGLSPTSADIIADVITAAERDDAKSHGLFRLPGYCRSLRSGRVQGEATPQLHDRATGVVHVDAAGAFAPVAFSVGLPMLVEKAKAQGVAVLSMAGALHFSSLWWEAEAVAREGLVALVFVNSLAFVAPHGATRRLYGTNPMAFAWPRVGSNAPLVWDQASSVMARGDITLAMLEGREIPLGSAIDADGNPTIDPAQGLEGAQCTFGGAKGSNIALMVELLAAGLTGGTLSVDTPVPPEGGYPGGAPTANGQLIIAIDPAKFPGGAAHAERVFDCILAEADKGARLPSARRFKARERTEEAGIYVPRVFYDAIETMLEPPSERPRL